MIFPEGRLTKTGALMKVYEGAGLVADKAGAKILPVAVEGLQFSKLSHMGEKQRVRWFPRLKLTILPPVDLTPPDADSLAPRKRREAIGRALQDVMVDAVFRSKNVDRTLFAALLDARALYGGKTLIAEDIQRQPISYNRMLLGAVALGRQLPRGYVGVMLPNSNATLVAFLGLQAFGAVPCMLNFSAGADAMLSACAAAGVRTVVSSRAFVEKGKLGAVVARMEQTVGFVWLEDLRSSIGPSAKLCAKWDAAFPRRLPGAKADPNRAAVVLFTSGSEGRPKGVVLSHRQLLSNVAQLSSVIDFHGGDILFNAMPVFHSFGLTGGTIVPLLSGVRTFHYPSPLHYRIVPGLIYDTDAMICFGTDTFLNGWARFAHPYDFYAMRYIFAGAEKVRDETKRLFADRFGVRILEGYGATETAPALAINTAMHCRSGSVGRFLPGIDYRLEPVAGVENGGRLFVRGPNVMLGYLRDASPGVLEPPEGGWYDTGDIVAVDTEGFVSIQGRAKRFAKIGGEMVSMTAAESLVGAVWPGEIFAVVAVADARKGEALVLVTARVGADVRDLLAYARDRGVPEIMVPRTLVIVDAVPVLGTGKVDYPAVAAVVAARAVTPAEPGERGSTG
jgi:acyl-[acyl-carrier-protein]-phospholipid O-acyltransferase/long-chain-fatty-acid--[acyl-carrier-protein] ligase